MYITPIGTITRGFTSLTFMLLCVPLPVWNTTRGKWSISFPEMTYGGNNNFAHKSAIGGRLGKFQVGTDIVCSFLDGITDFGVQAVSDVYDRSCFLQDTECLDEGRRQPLCGSTDVEVLQRSKESPRTRQDSSLEQVQKSSIPLGLSTPVPIRGNLEISKGILLSPELLLSLYNRPPHTQLNNTVPKNI